MDDNTFGRGEDWIHRFIPGIAFNTADIESLVQLGIAATVATIATRKMATAVKAGTTTMIEG